MLFKISTYTLLFSLAACFLASVSAQDTLLTDAQFEKEYQKRIKMEAISGVYIPFDIDDAFGEFKRLTEPHDLEAFKNADEDMVAEKLHFGIGRWMMYNWGFYRGSRLSHHLKGIGLSYPDDMAQFLIVIFHRKLNGKELGIPAQVEIYQSKRAAEMEERKKDKKVIKSFKRKRIE